jgi:Thioesterase domain
MLKEIQNSSVNRHAPIHMVQKGKPAQSKLLPFFLLHGDWTGELPLYCFTLARMLGTTQPFYALDPYKFDKEHMLLTLEDLATAHLQSMRAVQPEGPYMLGGFCSGAYLAYEMARQLEAQGQTVALLVLIAPSEISHNHERTRRFLNHIGMVLHISKIRQMNYFMYIRHLTRHMYRKTLPPDDNKIFDFPKLLALDARLNRMLPPAEALYHDSSGIFVWMGADYTPSFLPKNVKFIWASENIAYRPRWSAVEQDKNSSVVPGYYMKLLNENIQVLAEELKVCIDRTQRTYEADTTLLLSEK